MQTDTININNVDNKLSRLKEISEKLSTIDVSSATFSIKTVIELKAEAEVLSYEIKNFIENTVKE